MCFCFYDQGSRIYEATIKRVSISSKDYLFFFVKNSQWDALTTNEEIYSELILCPEDKNADEIDEVYYFAGDYEGIESMNEIDLQKIIQNSKLL